jgi:NAD(P)-dependent dehydrogenase (short-subunit alcohol dehydrogenase family)
MYKDKIVILTGANGQVGRAFLANSLNEHIHAIDTCFDADISNYRHIRITHDFKCEIETAAIFREIFSRSALRAELYVLAGVIPDLASIQEVTNADFEQCLVKNVMPAYSSMRQFCLLAKEKGIPASITVAGSVGASKAHRWKVAYDSAKAAMEGMTRVFALEYGSANIRSNVVAIGPIAQSKTTMDDGSLLPDLLGLVPMGRYAELSEVVSVLKTVGSPAFDFVNGQVIAIDGGLATQLRPGSIERGPTQKNLMPR